ncbi:MAG: hypothetical protein HY644_12245 [Acidobacteria bacterium]|nr:hypothetical protein [Acidobacteriota bacterium]
MRKAARNAPPSRRTALLCLVFILLGNYARAQSDYEAGTTGANRDPAKALKAGDPVSMSNGAYSFPLPLLSLRGPTKLGFELTYRSDLFRFDTSVPPSFWWRPFGQLNSPIRIEGIPYISVELPSGEVVSFKKPGSDWVPADVTENMGFFNYVDNGSRTPYVLKETSTFFYLQDPLEERIYFFQKTRTTFPFITRLVRVLDRNGNQWIYTYDPGVNPSLADKRPTRIDDGLGRSLTLSYGAVASVTYLQRVTDHGGRQIRLQYEERGADNANRRTLRSVTDASGQTTTFRYGGNVFLDDRLVQVDLPRGNAPYRQTYRNAALNGSIFPRVASQSDALGNTTTFSYQAQSNVVTVTNPDGTTSVFEHFSQYSQPKALTDAASKKGEFSKNASEQLTGIADRSGGRTSFTYHAPSGRIASLTNAKGDTIRFTYTPQDQTFTNPVGGEAAAFTFYNLARTDYPDGASEQFTYDTRGNLLTRVDQAGQTWTFTYNSRGQVLTAANPAGGVATMTYNDDATVATRKDSDTGVITLGYDALKRITQVTHADGTALQIAYDARDRITSITDENNRVTTYAYDGNGNLARVTDAAGKSSQFAYDALDRRTQSTDRLGKTATWAYDSMGRLASVTDPTGISAAFSYDPRGWLARLTRSGRNWSFSYDDEGILAATTTPLGHASRIESDVLGLTRALEDPLNQVTTLLRDSLNRVTSVSDPLGRTTALAYDARGQLTGVTLPVVGAAAYQRDLLGQLTQITDLNGQNWSFGYTPMGRLASERDPLGRVQQYSYDSRGRPSRTVFSDGTTAMTKYDAAGNRTQRAYSDGTDIQFSYDSLSRLVQTNGLQFTYDAEGRIVDTDNPGVHFGATFDDAGRLKSTTYNNNALTVTYAYDAATGLLSRVSDSLTGTQLDFAYDNDFRLAGITRPNSVSTALTWDNAARLTRIQEGSVVDLKYTLDAAGQVAQVDVTAPLDPSTALTATSETFLYDAASQLRSDGYGYDAKGRLTASQERSYRWDGASRLVRVGATTLAYNGLGQVVARSEAGTTLHYYYNHALALTPVVAEKDEATGKFLRYYVWTPGGALLYMIDAADGNKVYFYHFDRMGSTLALTDAAGKVTDSYAYDPYGRVLAHQGIQPQPFTFVGRWGVRQEGPGGTLYQMRARYYDALTARFISRDPVWPEIDDPAQINPYQYARNNPLQYADFTGRALTQAEQQELDYLVSAMNRYSRDLQGSPFSSGERDIEAAENTALIWQRAVAEMEKTEAEFESDPEKKKAKWQQYEKSAEQLREREEEVSKQRERTAELISRTRQETRNNLERMEQRFKDLWLKKVGGKNAFLGKRRLLIKVLKEAAKAGPEMQTFYKNLAQILFEQVEPLFLEFTEDLGVFEGDTEAMEVIRALGMEILFGR